MQRLLYSLVLFFIPLLLSAQAFDGGLMAGISVNQIDGDTYGGYNIARLVGGAWITTNPLKKSRMRMELRYYGKGAAPKASLEVPSYPRTRLSYVDLPLLWERQLGRRVSSQLGMAAGYLMKAEEDINGNGWLPTDRPFRSYELSGQLGVTVSVVDNLLFSLRWSYSMLPVRLNPGNAVRYFDRGQYNNNLAFALCYTLNRRK